MQNGQINLDEFSNILELKGMAYDQIAANEQGQRNLQAINGRIAQLSTLGAELPSPNAPSGGPTKKAAADKKEQ